MPPKRKPCSNFEKSGKCRFGKQCRFAHGDQDDRPAPPPDALQNWRRLVKSATTSRFGTAANTNFDYVSFFQQGLEIAERDASAIQEVVTLLAKPDGLERVRGLISKVIICPQFRFTDLLDKAILPFFKILCAPTVANSNVLEKDVVTIYNCVCGPNSDRAVELFQPIVSHLMTADRPATDDDFNIILSFYTQMMIRNGSTNVNALLLQYAEILIDKALELTAEIRGSQHFGLRRTADQLNRHFDIGKTIPSVHVKPEVGASSKAKFRYVQPPPGGRHDNDYLDIRQIKIMPTYAEIISDLPEYLPTRDGTQQPDQSEFQLLIDRHFRLLREDTIGQLRDAVQEAIKNNTDPSARQRSAGLRTNIYRNVKVLDLFVSPKSALEFFVKVDLPKSARSAPSKSEWWDRSKRLQVDTLVCLIGLENSITYCTVSAQGPPKITLKYHGERTEDDEDEVPMHVQDQRLHGYAKFDLTQRSDGAYFTLKPISTSPDDLDLLLQAMMELTTLPEIRIVEFPGVVLPAFQPTLLALQSMYDNEDMPFADILAAGSQNSPFAGLPAYTRSRGFSFDLACLTSTPDIPLVLDPQTKFDMSSLTSATTLDDAQAIALVHALQHSLALVQGPPGTGKSYTGIAIIRALLHAKKKANLGPIICVCFTNHALDQLLEHLHAAGITQMVRMGSRSKSTMLENVNLHVVARSVHETPTELNSRRRAFYYVSKEATSIADLVPNLLFPRKLIVLKPYLRKAYPKHYHQLFDDDVDEDGFETVRHDKSNQLESWLRGGQKGAELARRSLESLRKTPLREMTHSERQLLYNAWIVTIKCDTADEILAASGVLAECTADHRAIQNDKNLRCLEGADIIGVTTSGLARQLPILRKLRSKVLICEEAGEVLEAHLLPALLPSLEHVVLIGDHLQLRPQTQNYHLSRESSRGQSIGLDLSLFERLIHNPYESGQSLPHKTLEVQRRMHPSISRLIRDTLYPALQDAANVADYPAVIGLKKRLFWLDHRNFEDSAEADHAGSTSHSNVFEIQMVTAIVAHLIRQGAYRPGDIAVLTPYLSQLFKLRKSLGKITEVTVDDRDLEVAARQGLSSEAPDVDVSHHNTVKATLLESVRVATVDNFQGEEAKVIIISLTRSNVENACGFLKTSNRINVLLSRAQHGMYIIGNSATAGSVGMWSDVIDILKENDSIGNELELQCPRHQETVVTVSSAEDFVTASPEGGCSLLCGQRLNCGHSCLQKCHADLLHNTVYCHMVCPRSIPGCDHACPNPCGDPCVKECPEVLLGEHVVLSCEHVIKDPKCWQKQHPADVRCKVMTEKKVPGCQHPVRVQCYVDVTVPNFRCNSQCGEVVQCGHACQRSCFKCRSVATGRSAESAVHGVCLKICGRKFDACNHSCSRACHEGSPCLPCKAPCESACSHSKCTKKCSDPCAPCASSTCATSCPHGQCTMPCAAPCNYLPCNERCTKLLSCNHQCPSLCGEDCPDAKYCQICAAPDIKEQCADMVAFQTYGEIDLDEDICIVPSCGHVLTVESMDGMMELKSYYEADAQGNFIRPLPKDIDLGQKVPACPSCRGPLCSVKRYGRIVRQALLANSTKQFISWSNARYVPLAQAVQSLQERLAETSNDMTKQFATSSPTIIDFGKSTAQHITQMILYSNSDRYVSFQSLFVNITTYAAQVRAEEQPFKRVWDLVQHAKKGRRIDVTGFSYDGGLLQTRQHLLARSLLARCHLAILSDFLSLVIISEASSSFSFDQCREECASLANMAKERAQPGIEAEVRVFFGRYCAAEQFCMRTVSEKLRQDTDKGSVLADRISTLKQAGLEQLAMAKAICKENAGSTRHMVKELEDVENMVRQSSIRDTLRPEEMKEIYAAMAREFSGTGHWYYCENRHPFTIGECGMPMQQARCPQCDAPIGGQNHRFTQGVARADDLERQMQSLNI